jgi:methylphosphotriester-DNA--protein-cysteine methyltransferase
MSQCPRVITCAHATSAGRGASGVGFRANKKRGGAGKQQPEHKEIIAELVDELDTADAEGLVEELAAAAAGDTSRGRRRARECGVGGGGRGRRRFRGLCRRRRGGG